MEDAGIAPVIGSRSRKGSSTCCCGGSPNVSAIRVICPSLANPGELNESVGRLRDPSGDHLPGRSRLCSHWLPSVCGSWASSCSGVDGSKLPRSIQPTQVAPRRIRWSAVPGVPARYADFVVEPVGGFHIHGAHVGASFGVELNGYFGAPSDVRRGSIHVPISSRACLAGRSLQ